jgi:hypothetical protein
MVDVQQIYPYLGALERALDARSGDGFRQSAQADASGTFRAVLHAPISVMACTYTCVCTHLLSRCRTPAVPNIKTLFRLDNTLLHQAIFALNSVKDVQLRGACRRWVFSALLLVCSAT